MKNAFYFMFKAPCVLEILKFFPDFFGNIRKWLDKKAKVNFRIYNVTHWITNNYNTHINQYLKK